MPKFSPAQKFAAALRALSAASADMAEALRQADAAKPTGKVKARAKPAAKPLTPKKASKRAQRPGRKPLPLPAHESLKVLAWLSKRNEPTSKEAICIGVGIADDKLVTKILDRGLAAKVIKKHGKARWTSYSLKTTIEIATRKLGLVEPKHKVAKPRKPFKTITEAALAEADAQAAGTTLAEVFAPEANMPTPKTIADEPSIEPEAVEAVGVGVPTAEA